MKTKIMLVFLLIAASVCAEVPSRTVAVERQAGSIPGPACEDGLILDDGTAETAYSWVPSSLWGEYVQTFPGGSFSSSRLDSICVCWTRTHADDSLDFEVVVYSGSQSSPNRAELYSIPASFETVPEWPATRFIEVQIPADAPTLGAGSHHIGVRWSPSVDQFFFLCADQSPVDHPAGGFFRDDRSEGQWGSVLDSTDPIFWDHAAMMVRVRAQRVAWVPTLGSVGILILVVLFAITGWYVLRPR